MSSSNETELRETICSVFRGKPVERVELFGSAARGGMTPQSDVDILVTPSPAATRRDLFVMAAEVEDAVGRQVDFLIRANAANDTGRTAGISTADRSARMAEVKGEGAQPKCK